jgi:hypothetical protein
MSERAPREKKNRLKRSVPTCPMAAIRHKGGVIAFTKSVARELTD